MIINTLMRKEFQMVFHSNSPVLNIPSYRHKNDVIDILYLLAYLFISLTMPMTITG